ncbi:uncharacterized protein LOC110108860 isoform X2 [Dendrobium catenatum]|uniref:uncharacterized protein LOC110108860 isoform X2 n=1 Tax=Dendrobium catenatum TaxID=906689 RepID=UPI0009F6CCF9|nr:uncharacterized protein LOC110108860 isoform X2 [Dendrobium catenatum]
MSLAIVEKRPQRRPGGCAGIFFQLLDWNRRLAKKKLFSRKLLPPVRTTKRPMKKFGGDEKLPKAKLMLIADENLGGFPSAKKADSDGSPGNAMQAPGLVARLMGLESIPAIEQEKPRKALDSEYYYDRDKSGEYSRLDQDLCHEVAGQRKLDSSRPQKLQKTGGFLERRPANAARFSPDATHRSVVARSRKEHHKLASPVKSPRLLSRGNKARLMQAATKILEPGPQAHSRSRRAITCNGVSESECVGSESAIALRSKEPQNDSLIGSCRSCGKIVEFSQLRFGVEDNKFHNGATLFAAQAKFDTFGKARFSMERKHQVASDQAKCKPPQEANPKVSTKSKTLRRTELPMGGDIIVPGSKLCSRRQIEGDTTEFMGSKHFVGVKKNLNSSPRLKSPSKVSSCNGASREGNAWEKSVARKRRSSSNLQTDNKTASNPSFMKQKGAQSGLINKKESGLICDQAINRNRAKYGPQNRVNVETSCSGDAGIVSFTFSSPMKHTTLSFMRKATSGKIGDQMQQKDDTFKPKMMLSNANKDILPSPTGKCSVRGDELSNLLKEKIRELNSLDQDEVGIRDTSGRSTASILEELISALTAGESVAQIIHNDAKSEFSTPEDNFIDSFGMLSNKTADENTKFDINQKFQVGPNPFIAASVVSDSNHPSPISIFDASFSSESCSVGSFNGSFDMKESKTRIDFRHKCNKTESLSLDSDLLDSANSVEFSRSDNEMILNSSRSDFSIHSIQSYNVGILGTKVSFSTEAISKTKLLLESILFFDSDNTLQSSVNFFLLDIFASISDAFFARMKSSLSLSEANDYNHLKDFLFDFLIESLVKRFDQFCMSGYKVWLKLPFLLSKDQLLREIYGEIGRLLELAGKVLGDLAEQELSSSTIRWTAFEAEASWAAMDIESVILQELVDEMIMDLFVMSKLMNDFNYS